MIQSLRLNSKTSQFRKRSSKSKTELFIAYTPSEYGDDEILIKVVVAGSNPKDWKHPMPQYFVSTLHRYAH